MSIEDVLIIGAGPAGLGAACQLLLYGLSPLVMEKDEPGGLLLNAGSVRNYPGVPPGTPGRELIKRFPIPDKLIRASASSLTVSKSGIYQTEWAGGLISSYSVIVASGTVPVLVPLPGVSHDRVFYEVRKVPTGQIRSAAVIGGGDAALDYALTLSAGIRVNVYSRSGFSKAMPHLIKQASATPSITMFSNHREFAVFSEDIVLVACGRKKNVGFIAEDLLCSPPDDDSFHLCGDCANGIFRQASIASGDGVKAAMKTREYLRKRKLAR